MSFLNSGILLGVSLDTWRSVWILDWFFRGLITDGPWSGLPGLLWSLKPWQQHHISTKKFEHPGTAASSGLSQAKGKPPPGEPYCPWKCVHGNEKGIKERTFPCVSLYQDINSLAQRPQFTKPQTCFRYRATSRHRSRFGGWYMKYFHLLAKIRIAYVASLALSFSKLPSSSPSLKSLDPLPPLYFWKIYCENLKHTKLENNLSRNLGSRILPILFYLRSHPLPHPPPHKLF